MAKSPDTASETTSGITRWIKSADPLADKRAYLKMLTQDELKLYGAIQKQMRDDTEDLLTDAEYEQLSIIRFWLDKFDAWQSLKKPDEVHPQVAEVARKYRGMILDAMSKERHSRIRQSGMLERIKNIVLEWEQEGGGKVRIEASKEKTVEAKVIEDADG